MRILISQATNFQAELDNNKAAAGQGQKNTVLTIGLSHLAD
jgi:hypothetical protein